MVKTEQEIRDEMARLESQLLEAKDLRRAGVIKEKQFKKRKAEIENYIGALRWIIGEI